MKKLLSTSAFSLVAAVLLAACSIDAPPTAPTMLPSSDAVSLGKSPEQIAKKAAKEARKDSLEAIRDSIKTAAKLDKELLKAQSASTRTPGSQEGPQAAARWTSSLLSNSCSELLGLLKGRSHRSGWRNAAHRITSW
jgi:hypothetical protein